MKLLEFIKNIFNKDKMELLELIKKCRECNEYNDNEEYISFYFLNPNTPNGTRTEKLRLYSDKIIIFDEYEVFDNVYFDKKKSNIIPFDKVNGNFNKHIFTDDSHLFVYQSIVIRARSGSFHLKMILPLENGLTNEGCKIGRGLAQILLGSRGDLDHCFIVWFLFPE